MHFAKDEQAYIVSERFLLPKRDAFLFLVVRARATRVVPETALSSCSHQSFRRVQLAGFASRLAHSASAALGRFNVIITNGNSF